MPSGSGRSSTVGVLAAVALVMTGTLASVFFLAGEEGDGLSPSLQVTLGISVTPSELREIACRGWVAVDAPTIEGSYAEFDVLANLPLITKMAQSWRTDAILGSLYLDGVQADGMLDLSSRDDWDADYRFYSPTLQASGEAMLAVSEETVHSGLRFMVSESEIPALLSEHRAGEVATERNPLEPGCSLAEVMAIAREQGLEARPTYSAMLTYIEPSARGRSKAGYRWHISAKGISSQVVSADRCSAW